MTEIRGELRIDVVMTIEGDLDPGDAFAQMLEAIDDSNAPLLLTAKAVMVDGVSVSLEQAGPTIETVLNPEVADD